MSAPDLAKRLDVSKESVYGWEANDTTPRDPMLDRIAEALRVTAAWIKYGVTEAREPGKSVIVPAQPSMTITGRGKKRRPGEA